MKHRLKIVLTGGGSGGHITPLLSLAHELKRQKPGAQITYIGLRGDKLAGLEGRYDVFDQVYAIPAGKFRRYHGDSLLSHMLDFKTLVLNIRDFFRAIHGIFSAWRVLKKESPNVVFSKGSYVAVPVGLVSHWLRIPIITHDSDATAGLANKIIGRWAKVCATGMQHGNYPYDKQKIRYTGIPIDERIEPIDKTAMQKLKEQLNLPADGLVLLVGGASLGSQSINEKTVEASKKLLESFPKLRILHVTGAAHEIEINDLYKQTLTDLEMEKIETIGFSDEFYKYTGAADLVVTRAGATTIAELAVQGKAALLIPAPFLTGGQQLKNAEQLISNRAVEILDDNSSTDQFYSKISSLLGSADKRRKLAGNFTKTAKTGAAKDLAEIILKAAERS